MRKQPWNGFLSIEDDHLAGLGRDHASITKLTARFAVEGRFCHDDLNLVARIGLLDQSSAHDQGHEVTLAFVAIVTNESDLCTAESVEGCAIDRLHSSGG